MSGATYANGGERGPPGEQGGNGPQGFPGENGAPGTTGATGPTGPAVLTAGAISSGTSAAARWLFPGFSSSNVTATALFAPAPSAGPVNRAAVTIQTAGTNTGLLRYTLQKNNVNTAITVDVPATAAAGRYNGSIVADVNFDLNVDTYGWIVEAVGVIGTPHGHPICQAYRSV